MKSALISLRMPRHHPPGVAPKGVACCPPLPVRCASAWLSPDEAIRGPHQTGKTSPKPETTLPFPRDALEGGEVPRRNSGLCHVCTGGKQHKAQKENGLVSTPHPLQGALPMPSHCPPDAKCQLQWHL